MRKFHLPKTEIAQLGVVINTPLGVTLGHLGASTRGHQGMLLEAQEGLQWFRQQVGSQEQLYSLHGSHV